MPEQTHDFLTDMLSGQSDAACGACDMDAGLAEWLLDRPGHVTLQKDPVYVTTFDDRHRRPVWHASHRA